MAGRRERFVAGTVDLSQGLRPRESAVLDERTGRVYPFASRDAEAVAGRLRAGVAEEGEAFLDQYVTLNHEEAAGFTPGPASVEAGEAPE